MRAYVIAEDATYDQYLLKPLITRLLEAVGRANPKVKVHTDRLTGFGSVLCPERLRDIVSQRRGMYELFVLCVDRDGHPGRRQSLDAIERGLLDDANLSGRPLFGECAWQEIEVWLLAGCGFDGAAWQEVRSEPHAKERYFAPFREQRLAGRAARPGGGLDLLGSEAAASYPRIRQLCPEVQVLEHRISEWLTAQKWLASDEAIAVLDLADAFASA